MTTSSANNHIRICAFLTLAEGILALIPSVLILLVALGITGAATFGGEAGSGFLAGGILSIIAFGMAIIALPAVIAGFGLLARKPWARVLTLIIAVFNVLAFPIGTALAAYQFWVLAINEETVEAYKAPEGYGSYA